MSPEHPDMILSKDGHPFANDQAAKSAITRLGLDQDSHEVVQVEGGWGIQKVDDSGEPTVKKEAPGKQSATLRKVLAAKEEYPGYFAEACRALCFIPPGLSRDANAAMRKAEAFTPNEDQAAALWPTLEHIITVNAKAMKVFRVAFAAKSSPNDPDEVVLCVVGERLVVQREQSVCVPYKFLEAAENSTYPIFTQQPGKARKFTGRVRCYPFMVHGEATMEEFISQRAAGTKATREMVEKFGNDGETGS